MRNRSVVGDDADRLRRDGVRATLVPGDPDGLGYDANGNRTSVSRDGAVSNDPAANAADRISSDQIASGEGFAFGPYDNDGLVDSINAPGEGTYSFVYDHQGRPTTVTRPGGQQVRYGYDAEDRLCSRTEGGVATQYACSTPTAPTGR